TTAVTVGPIGANDAGIVPLVLGCLIPGCGKRDAGKVLQKVDAVGPELAAAIRAVRARAPQATVVIVGYGRYLPAGGCPKVQPISREDADFVRDVLLRLNRVISETAAAEGAGYADLWNMAGASKHTTCAAAGSRWFEGLIPTDGLLSIPFHPTPAGMKAFAPVVAEAVADARAER